MLYRFQENRNNEGRHIIQRHDRNQNREKSPARCHELYADQGGVEVV